MKFLASLILIFLGCFTGVALAADVAAQPEISDVVQSILAAVVHGQWWPALCAVVVLACALEVRYAPDSWKTGPKGRLIGTAVAFAMAFASTLGASAAAPGATMTSALATTALKVGVGAIGGYHALRAVIDWANTWSKMPAWLRSALNVVAALIGSSAVAKAEAAGAAAVTAAPAPGMRADEMKEID